MEEDHPNPSSSSQTVIIAALSSLSPSHLSHLTHHLSSVFHHHSRRVSALLSSPILFSLTLHHLHTLSLHHKSLLISRHLLSNLSLLANYIAGDGSPQPLSAAAMKLRDLDVLLLLLLLCELHQHDPHALDSPPSRWRVELCRHITKSALSLSNMGVSNCEILIKYVELVAKCRNFVNAMGCGGGDGKDGRGIRAPVAGISFPPTTFPARSNGCGRFLLLKPVVHSYICHCAVGN
nr:E3 ubiquitin-protein ligase SGR9, amyloplastic [Ipomoea batatas]